MPDLTSIAIILVVGVAAFLFGGPKVVEWARSAGKAKRVFNEEANGPPQAAPTAPR